MDLGLQGKRAVVAAASGGLGFAIARSLAREGCSVELCSRSYERATGAAATIAADTGASVTGHQVDVSDSDAVAAWIDGAAERSGGLDIVIPNAGGPPAGPLSGTSPTEWDDAYHLLLRSALMFALAAHPHMARGGSMLYLTSISAKEPTTSIALSGIFRAGVATVAKTLSYEWASDGIRVNHLIPGRIATERVADLDAIRADELGLSIDVVRERSEVSIPLGRYGDPDEFAAAATFLVSPAASYITGATLQVDGGSIRSV